jgi:signal transduction histidine kinase
MKSWLRGRGTALIVFLGIAGLVTGGLGWVTAAVLRLEQEQVEARAEADLYAALRPVLWRLDSRIAPILAREDSRPFSHYIAFYPPPVLFHNDKQNTPVQWSTILEPSPLQSEEVPPWFSLHFQVDSENGWSSPQVLTQRLDKILKNPAAKAPLDNVTDERDQLRLKLAGCFNPTDIVDCVKQRTDQHRWIINQSVLPDVTALANNGVPSQTGGNFDEQSKNSLDRQNVLPQQGQQSALRYNPNQGNDFINRAQVVQEIYNSKKEMTGKSQQDETGLAWQYFRNIEGLLGRGTLKPVPGKSTTIHTGAMVPLWLTGDDQEERLFVARVVEIDNKQVCQGIVLDWSKLQGVLKDVVQDSFPDASFLPVHDPIPPRPERTMTTLPVELDPGPLPPAQVEPWTPLRIGLSLAWVAALIALTAVGLGGWSLLSLSERRIRFVHAVTHELRTPLTTQRLYLDMLAGGLVKEDQQGEYIQTLHAETNRLHRLVSNVLDFARLERQRPKLEKSSVAVTDLVEQVRANWQGHCQSAEKELVVQTQPADGLRVVTDVNLVEQILANLIDNACKYSRGAEDQRIWLRARREANQVVLEVEDRGPGVPVGERRSIFRAFRRGPGADVTAGGVGLGLALASQWAELLGGKLSVTNGAAGVGACFRLELPC